MTKDKHKTKVVFRVWKPTDEDALESVIAFFPDIDEGKGQCSSYMHCGQHGGADYVGLLTRTRPATPEERVAAGIDPCPTCHKKGGAA